MPMSPSSPRGFHSAEADEAVREAARAEARRYRNSNNGNGFPRGEIPGGGCAAGAQWSAFSGTCVVNVHGAHRVSGDMPSPALVTTCIAVAAAAVIFVVVLWVFFVSTRALARRLRRAANGRKDGHTIWMAFRNAVIDTLVARFTESAVESMDAKTGVTTRQADQKKGDSGNGKTAKTQGASREEPEKAETAPSGVCLGTAMGAVVAGLARFAPDTIGETEAIAAAREMAAALTLYLELGAGGAGAFRESFVNAAAKAFVEETQKPGQKNPTSAVLLGSETTEVRIPKEQSTGVKKSTSNGSWHVVTPSGSPEEKRKETENKTENEKQNKTETETSERSGSASGTGGWFSSFAGIDPLVSFSGSFVSASPETAARNEKSVAETTERAGSEQEKNAAWGLSLPEILAAPPSNSGATGVWPQFPDPGLVLVAAATADETQLKALDLAVRYRRVLSSERANDIAEKHLRLNKLTLETQRLNLNVLSENNSIHVDANVLAQQKLEGDTVDRRTALDTKKHAETLAFIADAFYTGLTVVFVVTLAGGWRRAVAALTATVSVCPAPAGWFGSDEDTHGVKKQKQWSMSRALWSYATGANGPGPAEYMWCVLRSLVGAAWGGLVFALVAWKLLQYNVVTKFQTAPATVLLLLLGVGCGQIGRAGVDALGGDGDKWLRLWRLYVLCVALCTWRAKMLRSVFDTCGPLGRAGFFALVAVAAPFTVGAAPFEDVFAKIWVDVKHNVEAQAWALGF